MGVERADVIDAFGGFAIAFSSFIAYRRTAQHNRIRLYRLLVVKHCEFVFRFFNKDRDSFCFKIIA